MLDLAQGVEVDIEARQRRPHLSSDAQIVKRIDEQPPDEEFERQVIDVPLLSGGAGLRRLDPAVHDAVADGNAVARNQSRMLAAARSLPMV